MIDQSPPWVDEQHAFMIDGTTVTLSPTSSLRNAYPPATNQHGETVWPVMLLMIANEAESGIALIPEFGAMYGEGNTSEARQAAAIAARIPAGSLVLADAGFGIFSVAHAMVGAGHDILFRLTKSRFKSLRRQATRLDDSTPGGSVERSGRYRLNWVPSAKDRKTNPDLPVPARVEVYLHEMQLDNGD